ncbi:hypothetical protein D1BOALGB6SA_9887 [Olavius sp. associated proteobacterium Delta 1]|nr:hypothetical protein D1BOALGB6SA_9887 [Olavius sp. associated proteobacterium Delta 1]
MKVILVGGFSETIELCEDCDADIVGIFDKQPAGQLGDYPVLGDDAAAAKLINKYKNIPVVISPDNPFVRSKLKQYYHESGYSFISLIHPRATISKSAQIGTGAVIHAGVNVSSNASVGDFVRLNVNANLMHDVSVEDYTTVAPNAVLLGRVRVEACAYVGANSTILPSVNIGRSSVVGAGSVVIHNTPAESKVAGNPAKSITKGA